MGDNLHPALLAPSQDGGRENSSKRVHYEDAHFQTSDDDTREVEVGHHPAKPSIKSSASNNNVYQVTFDPTSPYRRKSSLVPPDQNSPDIAHQYLKKTFSSDCIVHQLLESQKRNPASGHSNPTPEDVSLCLDPYLDPRRNSEGGGRASSKISAIEPESDSSSASGQFDQQSWKTEVAKSRSELDMAEMEHENIHSRLLTKKQLTDMAWGVRELSRRLGMMRLKFRAENIFLLTKPYDEDLIPKTREVAKWLLSKDRDVRYNIYIQDTLECTKRFDIPGLIEELRQEYIEAGEMDHNTPTDTLSRRIRTWTEDMCRRRPHTFDLIVTLGGDGTVLYASWLFQRIVPPVLSFALGSLGFLTKFDFNDYQHSLESAFKSGVTVSLRLRFEGTVMRSQPRKRSLVSDGDSDGNHAYFPRDLVEEIIGEENDGDHTHKPDGTYEILNEVVVDRGPNPTLANIEIFGDDEHFTSVLADGVCVSTPTGSTAYNLAAGGSLCHPENPVMLVTAICAHTLSFRPIILPDTIVLRVGVPYDARTTSWASFDGRERIELHPGDYVTISASRFPFACVQPQGRRSEDWVNSISGKLGWNKRQKQKNEGYRKWEK